MAASNKQPDSSWLQTATVEQLTEKETLICALYDLNAVKLGGPFTLKSGIQSPLYIDLRLIISYPTLLHAVAICMLQLVQNNTQFNRICGVPYTALPIATLMCDITKIGMIMKRKEGAKAYGMKRPLEGHYNTNDTVLIIEDLVTSGASVLETVEPIRAEQLNVTDVVVLIDRQQNAAEKLTQHKLKLHSVLTLSDMLTVLHTKQYITQHTVDSVKQFVASTQFSATPTVTQSLHKPITMTYQQRAEHCTNVTAKRLLHIMESKRTNLCFSIDVTNKSQLLQLADTVGPHICLLKTHIDILNDFDTSVTTELVQIAQKHNFLIFEDRKFADIGNTVVSQYAGGVYKIADWSDITNAHIVPGSGIIDGLKSVGMPQQRALLLLAEMSSAGAMTTGEYTQTAVKLAESNTDFVIGFICLNALSQKPELLNMTPGIQFNNKGDKLGQQYIEPDAAIQKGTDIIIVGRGILAATNPAEQAQKYQQVAWQAYLQRTNQQ